MVMSPRMKRRSITTRKTEQINIDKCNFKFYVYAVVADLSHKMKADIHLHYLIQITVYAQTGRELQQTPQRKERYIIILYYIYIYIPY